MKDYIERDSVIMDILCAGKIGKLTCIDLIKKAPAADVKPVVRGEWIDPEDIVCYKCSACGKSTNWERPDVPFQFCPRCGADMRGDGDDQH